MPHALPERLRDYKSPLMDTARWEGFVPRPDDVFVCTSYKAGTTWTQMICGLLIFNKPELPAPLSDLSPWIEVLTQPAEDMLACYEAQTHRRFIKTHTPLDGIPYFEEATYLYCGRDPRDVFVSMLNHIENMDEDVLRRLQESAGAEIPDDEPELPTDVNERFDMWLHQGSFEWEEDGFPFWSHFSHARSFWDFRHLPNLHFLHYSDLQADLGGQMRRVAALLGVDVAEPLWPDLVRAATFDSMKARPEQFAPEANVGLWKDTSRFFNKGTSGQWQDTLSAGSLAAYDAVRSERVSQELGEWLEQGSLVCGDPKQL
ncbi:MAG: sulfotransferase domain-containing protein [Deltaproteobacteria bacterium]|nr:sulfotransferase domain-containing protein [Deltaproteobacteria bacterium]